MFSSVHVCLGVPGDRASCVLDDGFAFRHEYSIAARAYGLHWHDHHDQILLSIHQYDSRYLSMLLVTIV